MSGPPPALPAPPIEPAATQAAQIPPAAPAPNPIAGAAAVLVSIPDRIEVKLVDATTLNDYENWAWCASVLSNAAIGFLVAYCQTPAGDKTTNLLFWITVVWTLLMFSAFGIAIRKRRSLTRKGKQFSFRIGDQIEVAE